MLIVNPSKPMNPQDKRFANLIFLATSSKLFPFADHHNTSRVLWFQTNHRETSKWIHVVLSTFSLLAALRGTVSSSYVWMKPSPGFVPANIKTDALLWLIGYRFRK